MRRLPTLLVQQPALAAAGPADALVRAQNAPSKKLACAQQHGLLRPHATLTGHAVRDQQRLATRRTHLHSSGLDLEADALGGPVLVLHLGWQQLVVQARECHTKQGGQLLLQQPVSQPLSACARPVHGPMWRCPEWHACQLLSAVVQIQLLAVQEDGILVL